jgi:hypothetical protein
MLICYLGHGQVYVGTSRKNKEEEVALLFLTVALFENSNKGEGGVDPFLRHSTTHSLHACRVSFVDHVQGSSFADSIFLLGWTGP